MFAPSYYTLQVDSGEYKRLAQELGTLDITHVDKLCISGPGSQNDQVRLLRASLTVAKALTCPVGTVCLLDWEATPAVSSELRGLPHWHSELVLGFKSSTDPTQPSHWAMSRAATLIPRTYHTWCLQRCECTLEERTALVYSLPSNRTADTPLRLKLPFDQALWSASVQALLALDDSCPHITVG